jgi:hypothetical protein
MTTATAPAAGRTTPAASQHNPGAHHRTGDQHRHAAQQALDANSSHLRFHLGDTDVDVSFPPVDKLAFYAGLGGAVAFGLIEWPIAALTGLGHLLSDDRHHRTVRALGEALDAAG